MNILFVCEYNACRSQMAEGIARSLFPQEFSIHSAGIYPGSLHNMTIEVMQEISVDLNPHRSKLLKTVEKTVFDYAVVLAEPAFPQVERMTAIRRLKWFYPDPALTEGTEDQVKQALREVRDELQVRIQELKDEILKGAE